MNTYFLLLLTASALTVFGCANNTQNHRGEIEKSSVSSKKLDTIDVKFLKEKESSPKEKIDQLAWMSGRCVF